VRKCGQVVFCLQCVRDLGQGVLDTYELEVEVIEERH